MTLIKKVWESGIGYWLLIVGLLLVVGLGVVRPNRGTLRRESRARDAERAEAARLARENRRLAEALAGLEQGDRVTWSRLVRKEFGWVAPGEVPVPPGAVEVPLFGAER